jgi:hypothetical protein
MEKTLPPCSLAVAGEEEEEINPQNQKTWHGETLILRTDLLRKLIRNDGSPLPPASGDMSDGEGRGTSGSRSEGRRRRYPRM